MYIRRFSAIPNPHFDQTCCERTCRDLSDEFLRIAVSLCAQSDRVSYFYFASLLSLYVIRGSYLTKSWPLVSQRRGAGHGGLNISVRDAQL